MNPWRAFQIIRQPNHLTIKAPPSSLFASKVMLGVFLLLPLVYYVSIQLAKRSNDNLIERYPNYDSTGFNVRLRRAYWISGVLTFVVPAFFLALGYSTGSIDLNRATNQAIVTGKITAFLPSQEHSIDLSSVLHATIDSKPNSRRIRLVVSGGNDLAYPIWSDAPGQAEAALAINRFLESAEDR